MYILFVKLSDSTIEILHIMILLSAISIC